MKRIFLHREVKTGWVGLLVAIAFGWLAVGCEEQDLDRTFQGPYFVRFTDSTMTVKESVSKPVVVRVHNVGPQQTTPITVNYAISGSAREGRDFTIPGTKGTVVIPANRNFGEIQVQLINNANNILESQSLTFTLTGVQPNTFQLGLGSSAEGGGGRLGRSMTLTIQDDCLFGGTYTGTMRVGTQTATVSDIDISSSDCKQYTISNWNIGIPFFSFDAIKPTLRFIDNGDNSLTIPAQGNSDLNTTDTLRGTGAWNPRNRVITLNLEAKLRLSNNRDTVLRYVQTYTPQ
ncbi:Calx-beta domain-containing protein [Spirosoma montaniterrae]|uniref:Uncharacterized protein n=1 Tax=Spirosoma montaniterrae TaxID=1178516 RepID=A0A1P9X3A9_9BACT|nr:Calx-beta domain-containing protein [Spirosoma montaniterrae]AQG82117.1 hypothetical protein AWR27_24160 [Spirosoma montaniterrae]